MMKDPCAALTSEGIEYREFSCMYPALDPFYFSFEKYYDPVPGMDWIQQHPLVPIAACCMYVILIVAGQAFFAKRERCQWRYTLAAWNLGLSVFSFTGMARLLPQLVHNLSTMSLRDNLCLDPRSTYGSGSSGLWIQLFIVSKFPELIDTFFIIIHKKPLIFLHWYHHITVLLYCWHSYATKSPPGIFFVTMNYSVHASMYGYYFLTAMRLKPKWFNPMVITAFQISQMIVGVAVTCAAFYFYQAEKNQTNSIGEPSCQLRAENNTAAFVMYGSYLFLFLQFFIGRYGLKQPKRTLSFSLKQKAN